MYEELIKSLRICGAPVSCKDCPHYAEQDPHCFIRLKIEAADAIEELVGKVEQLPRWISVSERLPENEKDVLAYYGFVHDGEMSEWRFFGSLVYFAFDATPHWQNESLGLTVTHWMPLPEPPKMDESEDDGTA